MLRALGSATAQRVARSSDGAKDALLTPFPDTVLETRAGVAPSRVPRPSPHPPYSLPSADARARMVKGSEGCLLAAPLALSRPDLADHLYLPPGQYQVAVAVGCRSGRGATRVFTLRSPNSGRVPSLVAVDF